MERSDKKIIHEYSWERNYNAGWQTDRTDISTVSLSGSWREAQLIVRGLQILRARILADKAAGVAIEEQKNTYRENPLGESPKLHEVETLLSQVEAPNYQGETEIRHEHER